jgi:hypothetical protein
MHRPPAYSSGRGVGVLRAWRPTEDASIPAVGFGAGTCHPGACAADRRHLDHRGMQPLRHCSCPPPLPCSISTDGIQDPRVCAKTAMLLVEGAQLVPCTRRWPLGCKKRTMSPCLIASDQARYALAAGGAAVHRAHHARRQRAHRAGAGGGVRHRRHHRERPRAAGHLLAQVHGPSTTST